MSMPSGHGPLAEVHHAAVIVGRVSGLNDGLARPGDRACISLDRLGALHRGIRNVFECDHLHDGSPSSRLSVSEASRELSSKSCAAQVPPSIKSRGLKPAPAANYISASVS